MNFNKVQELLSKIRKHINTHRYQILLIEEADTWNQVCSSLDVIDDTVLSIKAYLEEEFPSKTGVRYLYSYGILQSLFVQQDALKNLAEALKIKLEEDKDLKRIREKRNAAIGHPTKMNRDKNFFFYHISRYSMSKEGFELIEYTSDQRPEFLSVRIIALIETQINSLEKHFSKLNEKLTRIDIMHKNKFENNTLQNLFSSGMGYMHEKIVSGITSKGGHDLAFSLSMLESLREIYENLKKAIKDRRELRDHIEYEFDMIFRAFDRINEFLTEKSTSIDELDALIYEEYIDKKKEYFLIIAKEIDEEYIIGAKQT